MKIVNKTHWRTDQLRALAQRVAQDELDAAQRAKLHITFSYTRNRGCGSSGYASYTNHWMVVRLASSNPDKVDLAKVLAHEMAHTRGMKHAQMRGSNRYRRLPGYRERYAYAEAFPLETKPKKVKARPDLQAVRHQRVVASLKAWQTKLKRAQTAIRKLKTKDRYYQKALEQKAALQPAKTD